MSPTIFLTIEQVLIIHEDQIDRYGGMHGLKSLELLESAVLRPQTVFGGKELYPSIFDKASSLLHSIIFNHSFTDGNKRTAIVSAILFLKLNNVSFTLQKKDLADNVIKIVTDKWDGGKIALWLEQNSSLPHSSISLLNT
ncbi:MAG: type II toxin-antitoxin system death-on-curing family toxin [Patescibacteria group bacterium]